MVGMLRVLKAGCNQWCTRELVIGRLLCPTSELTLSPNFNHSQKNMAHTIHTFIASTDFTVLKKSKATLVKIISNLEGSKDDQEAKEAEELECILSFLDSFQDMAVLTYGKRNPEVVNQPNTVDHPEDDTQFDEYEKELDEEALQKSMDRCRDENWD